MKYTLSRIIGFSFCLAGIFLLPSSCTGPKTFAAWKPEESALRKIDSLCQAQMTTGHFPGLAIAVASGKQNLWTKGYGYANLEAKVPVDPENHLFRIGSISKTITAAALARMTERGEINLDAPIESYYKECPPDKGLITLRQLGGHLAGIRHYKGFEFLSNIPYTSTTAPLEVFIHDTLLSEPGKKFNYSTYGWTLISVVMEKAGKEPFPSLIRKEVNDPLNLADLKPDYKDSIQYQRVSFYEFRDSMHIPSPQVDNSNKWAGGGFLCSAEEVAKFGHAHLSPGYLKKKTEEAFTKSQTDGDGKETQYGIGYNDRTDKEGRSWIGHSGGSVGGTSMLLIYPEEDLVVVTLVNLSGAQMDDLAGRIADVLLPVKEKKE